MPAVSYTMSLRITHPSMKYQVISESLSLKPRIASNVGEVRENPTGRILGGLYKTTFCTFELIERNAGFFTDGVSQVVPFLTKHRDFLNSIYETGGRTELYVGVFVDDADTTGFTMEVDMMNTLADLRVQLSAEIYCD